MRDHKLVVADDDRMLRLLLAALLKEYEVLQAIDGRSAVQLVEEELPDLLILDRSMPDMDGLAVLRAIRASAAAAKTRVVILSAFDAPQDAQQGIAAGADAYLSKSELTTKLPELVKRLLAATDE
ncbi:MAG: hypothetical protein AUK47_27775 [Deltaproteobacteria bacterium CG2_30_63_29]|nr:MAG: hypothetical protein AUK47_27775 [Deltaproteobacteria bacterium CG2_30_63_29]PIV99934.1 MAG: two-component system response regulator [Deltaproteobacteria bacterium CG17_big_fil_post_rev_8_21_14_2_50_63_7]PJB35156.1 MAG: two-component system response regulator [Deltaproteobacteria bacterium CG_4_9_14_3_um_filter_63_12]